MTEYYSTSLYVMYPFLKIPAKDIIMLQIMSKEKYDLLLFLSVTSLWEYAFK